MRTWIITPDLEKTDIGDYPETNASELTGWEYLYHQGVRYRIVAVSHFVHKGEREQEILVRPEE